MRIGFVVLGVVLTLLGAVLMFIPLVTVSSQNISSNELYTANVTGYSITGTVAGTLTWSTNASTTFTFRTCSVAATPTLNGYTCPGTQTNSSESGTSGTFTFSARSGGEIVAYFDAGTGTTGSVSVKLAQETIGLIVLVLGVLLLLLGLVLKRPGKPVPPAPSPTPTAPPRS